MRCEKCGCHNRPGDRICAGCGRLLVEPARQNAPAPGYTPVRQPEPAPRRGSNLTLVAMLVVAAAVLVGFLYLKPGEETIKIEKGGLDIPKMSEDPKPTAEEKLNGWVKIDGHTYYFVDGERVTGRFEINGVDYYFSDTGRLVKIGYYGIPSDWADDVFYIGVVEGKTSSVKYHVLEKEVVDCVSLTHNFEVTAEKKGSARGTWVICVRVDGYWKRICRFELSGHSAQNTVEFDEPVTFDAFAIYQATEDDNNIDYSQNLAYTVVKY